MKCGSPIWKTLIHNYYEHIEDLVIINEKYILDLCYQTDTKAVEYLSKGHNNIIQIFIAFFQYQIHHSDLIGNERVKVTHDNFNDLFSTGHNTLSTLRKAGIVNPSPN